MTSSTKVVPSRIVVMYPHTRGFAYAVMDSPLEIVDMKLYEIKDIDVTDIVSRMREIVKQFQPATLVVEDCSCVHSRKGTRTIKIIKQLSSWARKKGIQVEQYSRGQVREVFGRWKATNKYDISVVLARNIKSLKPFVYQKPKYPNREKNIDALFTAISFGVTRFFISE